MSFSKPILKAHLKYSNSKEYDPVVAARTVTESVRLLDDYCASSRGSSVSSLDCYSDGSTIDSSENVPADEEIPKEGSFGLPLGLSFENMFPSSTSPKGTNASNDIEPSPEGRLYPDSEEPIRRDEITQTRTQESGSFYQTANPTEKEEADGNDMERGIARDSELMAKQTSEEMINFGTAAITVEKAESSPPSVSGMETETTNETERFATQANDSAMSSTFVQDEGTKTDAHDSKASKSAQDPGKEDSTGTYAATQVNTKRFHLSGFSDTIQALLGDEPLPDFSNIDESLSDEEEGRMEAMEPLRMREIDMTSASSSVATKETKKKQTALEKFSDMVEALLGDEPLPRFRNVDVPRMVELPGQ